jgi:hypothetical protein
MQLTKLVALMVVFPTNFFGAANLKLPKGGCAYGIPKYALTFAAPAAAVPVTSPLVVWTACPTVHDCELSVPSVEFC